MEEQWRGGEGRGQTRREREPKSSEGGGPSPSTRWRRAEERRKSWQEEKSTRRRFAEEMEGGGGRGKEGKGRRERGRWRRRIFVAEDDDLLLPFHRPPPPPPPPPSSSSWRVGPPLRPHPQWERRRSDEKSDGGEEREGEKGGKGEGVEDAASRWTAWGRRRAGEGGGEEGPARTTATNGPPLREGAGTTRTAPSIAWQMGLPWSGRPSLPSVGAEWITAPQRGRW